MMKMAPGTVDFTEIFDEYLEAKREDRDRQIGVYYPSEISFPCLRSLFLRYKHPEPPKKTLMRRFYKGDLWHNVMQTILGENRRVTLVEKEKSVRVDVGGFSLHGRLDALIMEPQRQQKYVVEIKTIEAFKYLNHGSGQYQPVPLPKEEHLAQLMFYLKCVGDAEGGLLLYIQKNRFFDEEPFKWFTVKFDGDIYDRMVERAAELHGFLVDGRLPPPEPQHWNGKVCGYCPYGDETGNGLCRKLKGW